MHPKIMCFRLIDKLFDDKRVAVMFLMVWLALVLSIFKDIGLLDTHFMTTFGPSAETKFMGVVLDTWYKWGMVASFTYVNTSINDFMSDAISPWLMNTISDHKNKYIPYPKYVCLGISQLWAIYCNLMSVFGMFLAMTQIDFVLIRMMADLTVNSYTNMKFMRNKEFCPSKYYELEERQQTQASHNNTGNKPVVTMQHKRQEGSEMSETTVFRITDDAC